MKGKRITVVVLFAVFCALNVASFAQNVVVETPKNGAKLLVNINTAGQVELEKLPGIGPSLAKKILDFRQKNGGFKNVTDLTAVPGIGDKKYEQLKSMITVK
jgi:comEA protein